MAGKKKYSNCDEVFKSLQKFFAEKSFETGDRVPSERQISDKLKVNRTTLRTAMQRMVQDGLLERKVGVGTFFRISPKEMAESYTKINTKCTVMELLETRIILEPKLAHLAAMNISDEDISALRKMCRLSADSSFDNLILADIEFHNKIAELARNSMLVQVYSVISGLRQKMIGQYDLDKICGNFDCKEKWQNHQYKIISAFEKRDSKAAYTAVKDKIDDAVGYFSTLEH